jgi:hypothetical protein
MGNMLLGLHQHNTDPTTQRLPPRLPLVIPFFASFLPEFPFPGAESPTIDGGSPLDATNNLSTDAGDSINAQVEHLLQYSNKKTL